MMRLLGDESTRHVAHLIRLTNGNDAVAYTDGEAHEVAHSPFLLVLNEEGICVV